MNNCNSLIIILFIIFLFPFSSYAAMDFEGAIIDYKDVPTRAWKYGVLGNKWIVSIVKDKSYAKQIGLKQGDIILTVDDKDLVSNNKLLELTDGKHTIKIFNTQNQVEYIAIDKIPANRNKTPHNSIESSLPSVSVNDDALAQKYGKTENIINRNKRTYQDCMDDELANASTYEYYVNKPNARGGDYGRAQRICDEEFRKRNGITIERIY